MRTLLTGSLFALALLVAACGGGGGSGMLPSAGGSVGITQGQTTKMPIELYVPAPSKQSSSRKPFYISSGTQSFGVLAVPVTSTESPNPINMQIFPVATPSPCAVASGGGYECTLTVVAPVGNDIFYIGAFATSNPNANAVPLSEFETGQITVGGNPNPNATPLSFTLNGVVYQVAITVPSPDPGNTPNTQIFPAGTPSASWPLGITAYDSSGNPVASDPTNVFVSPIVVTVSPNDGAVGLVLDSQCGSNSASARKRMVSFSGGSGSVSIACAADLNNVQFGYTGLTTPDPSDHVVDKFTISTATQMASPAPSPANVVLSSNVLSWPLGPNDQQIYSGQIEGNASGALVYIASDANGGNYVGTFDPSTQTVVNGGVLNGIVEYPGAFALDSSGTFWLADTYYGVLDCWPSVASAASGAAPTVSTIEPQTPGGNEISVESVAVDASNNIWYTGYDSGQSEGCDGECEVAHRRPYVIPSTAPSYTYAGYIPATACTASVNTSPFASAYLAADYDDQYPFVAPLNSASGNGIFVNSSNQGVGAYVVTTSSGNVNAVMSQLGGGGTQGVGAAVDGAGTAYAAFTTGSTADIESMPSIGSAFTALLGLPPYPSGSPDPGVFSIDAFSPTGGAADRIDYADNEYEALGLVESVPASPMPLLAPLPSAADALWATHSSKGGEYVLYLDSSGNLDLARVIPTTTWSVPNLQFESACGEVAGMLGIVERGDRGPFAVTYSPAPVSNTLLAGTDHDYLTQFSGASSISVQIVDAGGRTETYPISTFTVPVECGITHRPLHRDPRVRPHFVGKRTP